MSLKYILAASAAASALVLPTTAMADNWYVSVFGGWSSPDGDVSAGPFSFSTVNTNNISPYYATSASNRVMRTNRYTALTYDIKLINADFSLFRYRRTTWGTAAFGVSDDIDDGFVIGGAIGLDFQDGWRAELEAAYRQYDLGGRQSVSATQFLDFYYTTIAAVDGLVGYYTNWPNGFISSTTIPSSNPVVVSRTGVTNYASAATATMTTDGAISSFSMMANVWYDFDLGNNSPITPFIGFGVGVANVDAEYSGRATMPYNFPYYYWSGTYVTNTFAFNYSADAYVFAWQAGAGIAYEFEGGATLSAQYRYFATGDVDLGPRDISIEAHEGIVALSFPLGAMN